MPRSSSVPKGFHSLRGTGRARRDSAGSSASLGEALLSGSVLIRATPESTKVMRVQFVAMHGELRISFTQVTDSCTQSFELCRLDYRTLAVGWFRDDPAMFILAATHNDKLFHEIYCYPTDVSRNLWLGVLKSNNAIVVPMFLKNMRIKYCVNATGAHETDHTFGHVINAVREVTEFELSL